MHTSRPAFLTTGASATGGLSLLGPRMQAGPTASDLEAELERILARPVLSRDFLPDPVVVASLELLRKENTFLVRARSKAGVEIVTVPHQGKLGVGYPVLLEHVMPVFVNRHARDLESLLWEVYRAQSNYKMQGLLFWVAVAAVEMALLGRSIACTGGNG